MKNKSYLIILVCFFAGTFLLLLCGCNGLDNNSNAADSNSVSNDSTLSSEMYSIASYLVEQDKKYAKAKDFEANIDSFMALIELLKPYGDFSDGKSFNVYYANGKHYLSLVEGDDIPTLTDGMQIALEAIYSSFQTNNTYLETIRIFPEQVVFDSNSFYALVYTMNEKKPSYMSKPTDKRDFDAEKIQPHWFHVFAK